MKPRKEAETDAEYIARLEAANTSLRENNKINGKAIDRVYEITTVVSSRLGLMFDYAADICGMAETDEHLAMKRALGGLCHMQWKEGVPTVPPKPNWVILNNDPPSDAGMILKSALEKAKSEAPPWADGNKLFPDQLPPVSDWNFKHVEDEMYHAFTDLEFSRGLLRDDLRSAMYDHCFLRIHRAVTEGVKLAKGEPISEEEAAVELCKSALEAAE